MMTDPRAPLPVKLFVGMLSSDPALFESAISRLIDRYGPVSRKSSLTAWDHSTYYFVEMGTGLLRQFVFFASPIGPGALAAVKNETIRLEHLWSVQGPLGGKRRINLDPGYVTEAKVVLATTKDFPHRIYIGDGIYAEPTLQYSRELRGYTTLPHTYPDFRTPEVLRLFCEARDDLRSELGRHKGDRDGDGPVSS